LIHSGAAMPSFRIQLKAVLYEEDGTWLAHCLELDLIGDGDSAREALHSLSGAIITQLESSVRNNCMESIFCPAEARFWSMFAQGKNVAHGELELQVKSTVPGVTIEDLQAREYSEPANAGEELVPA
jgi:hypothetical protein